MRLWAKLPRRHLVGKLSETPPSCRQNTNAAILCVKPSETPPSCRQNTHAAILWVRLSEKPPSCRQNTNAAILWVKHSETPPSCRQNTVRNHTAEVVARVLLDRVINRFGTPLRILSDQGRGWKSTRSGQVPTNPPQTAWWNASTELLIACWLRSSPITNGTGVKGWNL